ncbi:biotin/lipoyl-containing protein [Limnochorda pilosa]|uniref:Acetyl-CoA carboxylase n=1 Tax=Limnochorda pilosa TaxID=1555112 RepID=A0A0K2SPI0_LIMPI|nr:biotin/lipoyl-containing protein [Limnochorda pilosa]BAS29030.1 acetyl-CoA carboxylase [Limnochorda pilosa]
MKQVLSDMAGILLEVKVGPGDEVRPGQEVAVLESMKMQIPVQSAEAGVVRSIHVQPGHFVNQGDPLLDLE